MRRDEQLHTQSNMATALESISKACQKSMCQWDFVGVGPGQRPWTMKLRRKLLSCEVCEASLFEAAQWVIGVQSFRYMERK